MAVAVPLISALVGAAGTVYAATEAASAQREQAAQQQRAIAQAEAEQRAQERQLAGQETAANVKGAAEDEKRRAAANASTFDPASETLLTGTSGVKGSLLSLGVTGQRKKPVSGGY